MLFRSGLDVADDIFYIVFFVALVSVLIQGTLLGPLANKLDLVSLEETVLKTFTDYSGDIHAELLETNVCKGNKMVGKAIKDLNIPSEVLIVMIRRDGKLVTPRGNTVIKAEDILMLAGNHDMLIEISERSKEQDIDCED